MRVAAHTRTPPAVMQAARDYVEHGYAVTPLAYRSKAATRNGWADEPPLKGEALDLAFADAGGVGIRTGTPSGGLMDVDLDSALARRAWPLIGKPTDMRSGRPGSPESHAWYVVDNPPSTERLRDPARKDEHGKPVTLIELRGTGGQTVVWPSIHQETGEACQWHAQGEPARVDLEDLQRRVRRTAAAAMLADRWADGARHDIALALAGMLLRGGMSQEDVEEFIEVIARIAGDHEVADRVRAVRDTAAVIDKGEPSTGGKRLTELMADGPAVVSKAREWLGLQADTAAADDTVQMPPIDPWADATLAGRPAMRLDAIPTPEIAEFAADEALRKGGDPALVASLCFGVAAAALHDGYMVQPRLNDPLYRESARLWIGGIAGIGAAKSPLLAAAIGPLRAVEQEEVAAMAGALERYDLEEEAYKHDRSRWVKSDRTQLPPTPPTRPHVPQRITNDATIEALADVAMGNTGGPLAEFDELMSFFGGFDQYRPRAGADRPKYLKSFNGGPDTINRKGRRIVVPNWSLSIVGITQEGPIKRAIAKFDDDGLAQRFLWAHARDGEEKVDAAPDAEAVQTYDRVIRYLARLPGPPLDMPVVCKFSPEVRLHCDAVLKVANAMRVLPDVPTALKGHLAKYETFFARLALTFHAIECAVAGHPPAPVIAEHIGIGVARLLLEFFLPHAAAFYADMAIDPTMPAARQIAGHIIAGGLERITARQVGRTVRDLRGDTKAITATMDTLVALNWVTPSDANRPGGWSQSWTVNPEVHRVFAERAAQEREEREAVRRKIAAAAALLRPEEAQI